MAFTEEEKAYLHSQRLARLATVSDDGQPDVVPVGFEFDGDHFSISGYDLSSTRKYRNVRAGHDMVALVVDDLATTTPWTPRFVRVYGRARIVERTGGSGEVLEIAPTVSWSWNLGAQGFTGGVESFGPRRTVHSTEARPASPAAAGHRPSEQPTRTLGVSSTPSPPASRPATTSVMPTSSTGNSRQTSPGAVPSGHSSTATNSCTQFTCASKKQPRVSRPSATRCATCSPSVRT